MSFTFVLDVQAKVLASIHQNESNTFPKLFLLKWLFLRLQMIPLNKETFTKLTLPIGWLRFTLLVQFKRTIWSQSRRESKPERRSGKKIIAGTAFRLEFLVGWYYDVDATMAVHELY